MSDKDPSPNVVPEPDTEGVEPIEDEAPTEEHEPTASETQASELATIEVLASEVDELRARARERDDLFDRLQRSKADFVNYQKRMQRERERWTEMAIHDLALHVLPVLDDLDRALDAARQSHDANALIHGLELIMQKLLKALADEGITAFEAHGKPFDPAFHEALAHHENPEVPDQSVMEVLHRGYMIHDRVLRAAQVVVAKGGPPPELDDEEPGTEDVALPPSSEPPADDSQET